MQNKQLEFIGESDAFSELLTKASKVAKIGRPILVIGERGTGKELIAERVHFLSTVWDGPFLKINCATFTEELLASELFGHEAGSFTGATKRHLGIFERAHGGTVFLDEIANTSLRLQEKLLRVIEYGEFQRVGGSDTIRAKVRIVAATNEDLPTLCKEGSFRYDLLDRLAFDVLTLPPLRDRGEDIELLAEHFAMRMTRELKREYFVGFSKEALSSLNNYYWPGNVRELRNVIERAVFYHDSLDGPIEEIIFDPFTSCYRPIEAKEKVKDDKLPQGPINLKETLAEYEKQIIKEYLKKNKGNQTITAKELGLSYNQFRGILRKRQ